MSVKQKQLIEQYLNKYCIDNTIHVDLLTNHKQFGFKTYGKFKDVIDQYNLNIIYPNQYTELDKEFFSLIRKLKHLKK